MLQIFKNGLLRAGLTMARTGIVGARSFTTTKFASMLLPTTTIGKSQTILPTMIPNTTNKTSILDQLASQEEMFADSVLRKRRLKMKKHKLRKRRRAQRAMKRKLNQG